MAIIGILAAIAIPNLLRAQRRAKDSRAYTDTKQIVSQAQVYALDNNILPPEANMPPLLWDKSVPGNTVYMAATYDPWGATSTTNYLYQEDTGTGLTAEIMAYSTGVNKAGAWTIGGACSGNAVGYSSQFGSCP